MQKKITSVKQNKLSLCVSIIGLSLLTVNPAFAWGAKLTPVITQFAEALKEMGIPLITVALMFIGYQIAFSTKTLKALIPVIIGCMIVGSAPMMAQMLLASWNSEMKVDAIVEDVHNNEINNNSIKHQKFNKK